METPFDILEHLREPGETPYKRGEKFELLILAILRRHAEYKEQYAEAWRWSEWAQEQGIDGRDVGIDLVARTHEGEYCAIQCKFYEEEKILQKKDIDSFFVPSGQLWNGIRFQRRIIVSTTSLWSSNAENALRDQQIPCTRLDFERLKGEIQDWGPYLRDEPLPPSTRTPWPHQEQAIKDVIRGFAASDRGQLIMACGTGKTYTSLKIAEEQVPDGGYVLLLVPSLALLSQILREWSFETSRPLRCLAVCSDPKVAHGARNKNQDEDISVHDMSCPPTTDAARLSAQLQKPDERTTVVFATYQSLHVLHKAQQRGAPAFDLIICDEAHRTTGIQETKRSDSQDSKFTDIHDAEYLRGHKRLYMTATPRLYSEPAKRRAKDQDVKVYSMDEKDYGEEFHRLDFSTAVQNHLLSDYKVLILAVNETHVSAALQSEFSRNGELSLSDAAKIIGCWDGLSRRGDKGPMRRAVAFTHTIKASKQITEQFVNTIAEYPQKEPDMISCAVHHVDGTQNALIRTRELQWLREDSEECRVLSNVRCLSEGVDVPSLDAVIFMNPRKSQVDIVQSVGRVMRKAEGKDYGYIILPIGVPAGVSSEDALDDHERYRVVWNVLQALRSHDNRFNAEINKIDLNKGHSERISIIGVGGGEEQMQETSANYQQILPLDIPELSGAIYAKIVLKCGTRRYWESWAGDVAEIAQRNITRIRSLVESSDASYRELFEEFLVELRQNINPSVSADDAIEMLSQHVITRPVFDALFEHYQFTANNPVSKTMQAMLELLDEQNLQRETESLQDFYESVRQRASGIDNAEGRQKVIIELYQKFFQNAFPKMAESLGIVYTPTELVDFILRCTDDLLRKELDSSLSAPDVHILDPFTGTGTFISRLLRSDLIAGKDLQRKYERELHANEIVLLAYYIAAVNIEESYHERLKKGDYQPFQGIVLTDTFQINERDGDMLNKIFPVNSERVKKQQQSPIRVVFGNPPYSAGQRSQNDANQNLKYSKLDASIGKTYAHYSSVTNKNSLYDSYIRAFRWASDRIGEEGVVAYISNGGWIDGAAMDGFRKCLRDEFSAVYCLNLRGNTRTSGELARREGGQTFGAGSRATIAITFLVKNPASKGDCRIYYHDIGDYLSRTQKLDKVGGFKGMDAIPWRVIHPNTRHDWINQRSEEFLHYLPLGDRANKKQRGSRVASVFSLFSGGLKSNRDAWVYNFSRDSLAENTHSMIDFYNSERRRYAEACQRQNGEARPEIEDFVRYDSRRIHWDRENLKDFAAGKNSDFVPEHVRPVQYRPFCRQWLYFDEQWNSMRYQLPKIFPAADMDNLAICVSSIGTNKDFSTLMVNMTPDLELVSKNQCFPRYYYAPPSAAGQQAGMLFAEGHAEGDTESGQRIDNIPADTVRLFREQYGNGQIDGDMIFYYVYGILHNPEYTARFAADLRKMLPRVPYASSLDDFRAYSEAGKKLSALHTGYEDVEPWPLSIEERGGAQDPKYYKVRRMRFDGKAREPDKTVIHYNENITLREIPLQAYEYIVNGRSAIEWILESYQIKTHKDSGIVNDPNKFSDNPRYILELLTRVVRVSMESSEILKKLPPLKL